MAETIKKTAGAGKTSGRRADKPRGAAHAPFRSVALIGRYKSRDVAVPLARLGAFIRGTGRDVVVDDQTAAAAGVRGFDAVPFEGIGARADLAIVLGGDGSMLSAARALAPYKVPLVGVNQGRLGFTTDISLATMRRSVAAILGGDYSAESRIMLEATITRRGRRILRMPALNDVVVSKGATGRLIEFLVHIDGRFVYDLRSDGLIAATATGSTAYALSSGGPILHPGVPAVALVPICPHTLSNRPIAVPDRVSIVITMKRAADAKLHLDGQAQYDLAEGDRVEIVRSKHVVRLVHPPGYDYFAMLRGKLHWSESPLN